MVHLFYAIECEPSVPCLSRFVYSMDKVELSYYLSQRQNSPVRTTQLREQSARIVTPEDIAAVDDQLIAHVNRQRQVTHLIIDSHPVTKEQYGFRITAFSIEQLQALRPTMICMLYTEPAVVMERLSTDAQGRPMVTPHEAALHTELQASVAVTYGIVLGVPVYLFDSSKLLEEISNSIVKRLEAKNPLTKILNIL
jgi:adenylate kinase